MKVSAFITLLLAALTVAIVNAERVSSLLAQIVMAEI